MKNLKGLFPIWLKLVVKELASRINIFQYIKDTRVQSIQRGILKKYYNPKASGLVLYLAPGRDRVNGGVMAIHTLYNETKKIKKPLDCEVLLTDLPDNGYLFKDSFRKYAKNVLLKYTKFDNNASLINFIDAINYFDKINDLIIHIPEIYIDDFLGGLKTRNIDLSLKASHIHVNILLANILLCPETSLINVLKAKFDLVTCTTAHEKYSSKEISVRLGVPLHRFGTYQSLTSFVTRGFNEKKNLMLISPDEHPLKSSILEMIARELPHIEQRIIYGVPYKKYKSWLTEAKWVITFGEGNDGYFVEGSYCGAISFTVYNEDFFTKEFESLRCLYKSYNILQQNIVEDIRKYESIPGLFEEVHSDLYECCARLQNYDRFHKSHVRFYNQDYDFP